MTITSSDEAKPSNRQHKKPCHDCPWRRAALPGWLGSASIVEWVAEAHGDNKIACHTKHGPQCAGSSIYRANVAKTSRNPEV